MSSLVSSIYFSIYQSLQKKADENLKRNTWLTSSSNFRLSHLNIRSLKSHYKDLACDSFLLQSDIIAISETWFPKRGFILPEISAFQSYNQLYASAGRGKGVSLFINSSLNILNTQKVTLQPFQILKVICEKLTIILVYRSPASKSYDALLTSLLNMISCPAPTIVVGDFNIDPKRDAREYNKFISAMTANNFIQVINKATHIKGHTLDHMYIRNIEWFEWQLHHPYWTDHDAICVQALL